MEIIAELHQVDPVIGYIQEDVDPTLDLFAEIERMKHEKNAILLAHYYQEPDIQDIADLSEIPLVSPGKRPRPMRTSSYLRVFISWRKPPKF